MPELNADHAEAICNVLVAHGVDFVVIGGMAARFHQTGYATVDIDVCPATTGENLGRLATALKALGARLRVEDDPTGIPFDPHPATLRQMSTLTLMTDSGPLDVCFAPAGFPNGYTGLRPNAATIVIGSDQHRGRESRRRDSFQARRRSTSWRYPLSKRMPEPAARTWTNRLGDRKRIHHPPASRDHLQVMPNCCNRGPDVRGHDVGTNDGSEQRTALAASLTWCFPSRVPGSNR